MGVGKLAWTTCVWSRYDDLSDEQLNHFVDKFKRLADEKKTVTDADMEARCSRVAQGGAQG